MEKAILSRDFQEFALLTMKVWLGGTSALWVTRVGCKLLEHSSLH